MMHARTRGLAALLLVGTALILAAEARAQQGAGKGREKKERPDRAPKLGAEAPDFTLKTMDGKSEVNLTEERKRHPVLLIFGSYT